MPTTTTSTLGSGGDYATILAWNTARNTAAASGDTERLEILAGSYSTDLVVTLSGWTAGVIVEVVAQDGFGSVTMTGARLTNGATGATSLLIEGIEFDQSTLGSFNRSFRTDGTITENRDATIRNCSFHSAPAVTANGISHAQTMGTFTSTLTFENCVFYGNDSTYIPIALASQSGDLVVRARGCTIDGTPCSLTSFGRATPLTYDIEFAGCLLVSSTAMTEGGAATYTTALVDCILGSATPGFDTETNCTFSTTFNASGTPGAGEVSFTASASGDYTLVDHANNLALGYCSTATMPATDIVGTARDASEDAGAYEVASASPPLGGTMDIGWNMSPINYYAGCRPFLDMMKSIIAPVSRQISPNIWADGREVTVDANGYPQSVLSNQEIVYVITSSDEDSEWPSGTYVFRTDGDMTFTVTGGTGLTETSPGVWEFTSDGASGLQLRITAIVTPPTYMTMVHEDHVTASDGGELFHPTFVAQVTGRPLLRFMNWLATKNSTTTDTLRPQSYLYWGGDYGVPIEVCVALANKLGCDMWYCIPHQATDAAVTAAATKLLDCDGTVYVEYSNETWNGVFQQTTYVGDQGALIWPAESVTIQRLWYTIRRSRECWALMHTAGLTQGTKMQRVLASQAANSWLCDQMMLAESSAAVGVVDILSIAPYFGGATSSAQSAWHQTRTTEQFFSDYTAADSTEVNGVAKAIEVSLGYVQSHIDLGYGLPIVLYEGGQHYAPAVASDAALRAYLLTMQNVPEMGSAYATYLQGLEDLGVQGFCVFTLDQPRGNGKDGDFGHLPFGTFSPEPLTQYVKYAAVLDYIGASVTLFAGHGEFATTFHPAALAVSSGAVVSGSGAQRLSLGIGIGI